MIGKRFYKDNYDLNEYSDAAEWCNNNNNEATIVDKGDYYEVVKVVVPLEELKKIKILELKAERDRLELLPIEFQGNSYDFDQKSYERITAAIYALDFTGGNIAWTMADNKTVRVNSMELRGVIAQAADRSNKLHVKYRNLKEDVERASSAEEVYNIVWD